ncbi:MAG: hypothetical protein WA354_00325 [Terracidiphilus sp.]
MNETLGSALVDGPAMSPVSHAIAICTEAWTLEHQKVMKSNRGRFEADAAAAIAYRRSLPTLAGYDNIGSFVACVAHGIAIGAIEGVCASRLLYAAQVAKSTLRPPAPEKMKA